MRQLSIGRLIALVTGATVVLLLTIDTTMACRFLARHRYCSPSPPVTHCRVVRPAPCGQPVAPTCCGDVEALSFPVDQPVYQAEPTEAEPTPALAPGVGAVNAAQAVEDAPDDNLAPAVLPNEVQAVPTDLPPPDDFDLPGDHAHEPSVVDESALDLLDEPTIVEEPSDDLFDEPADALPADPDEFDSGDFQPGLSDDDVLDAPADAAPADDLFDEPAGDMPSDDLDVFDTPAGDASADDDLFGAPADDAPPADDLFDAPADSSAPSDDLFDEPVDDGADLIDQPAPPDADADLPGFDDPAPADAPADAAPADETDDSLDDLFGATSGASNAEPRTAAAGQPTTGDSLDGLDDPVDDAVPADDLFDSVPAEDDDNAVDDLDDLFGAHQSPSPVETLQTKPVAEQIEELPVRQWTDNTGRFHTIGRLVKVSPTHIRLLKDNGRFTTVSKLRLSEADLTYVQEVTKQLGVDYFDQVASR